MSSARAAGRFTDPRKPTVVARALFAMSALLATALVPVVVEAQIAASVNGVIAASGDATGTFVLERFVTDDGRLVAVGVLRDVSAAGSTLLRETTTVRITVNAVSQRTCEMLRVDLGPDDLELHGAEVHLNEFAIVVSDSADGPLRRSLCAVAEAPPSETAKLAALLNDVVNLVGCLMRGATAGCRPSPRTALQTAGVNERLPDAIGIVKPSR